MHKRFLGIYDLNSQPLLLGGLLTLITELNIQRHVHRLDFADLCFIGEDCLGQLSPKLKGISGYIDNNILMRVAPLSIIPFAEGIDRCFITPTLESLKELINLNSYVLWPKVTLNHKYESTLIIQEFFKSNGFPPYLRFKGESLSWALEFIEKQVLPALPVVLYLKNNPKAPGCSNANFDVWYNFISTHSLNSKVKFILIGNEAIDKRIKDLSSVLITSELEGDLPRELALIQVAYLFMGMASGPCTAAIYSDVPYVIFKNPKHDEEQMMIEMGAYDKFPFAVRYQKLLRLNESNALLNSEFSYMLSHISRTNWTDRIKKYKEYH